VVRLNLWGIPFVARYTKGLQRQAEQTATAQRTAKDLMNGRSE
jgi:hypothetical protein